MQRISVMKPWFTQAETQAVAEVIESGWVAQGPKVQAFETAFAQRQAAGHAVATSSCTTALQLALIVAGIGPGDEVIVPSFSFIATANAPGYVGALPVFADVDPATGNLTAQTVRPLLTSATRAVIAVDQGGVPVQLGPLRELCDEHGLVLIEDAACAAGSTLHGAPAGAGADAAAWSFHPRKLLTCGEGGMLTTGNEQWAARARRLREHSMDVSAAERHASLLAEAESYPEPGYNFRMTDLQAAVGLVQLEKLPAMVARRRELAARYQQALDALEHVRCVADPAWGEGNYQSFWIELEPGFALGREQLLAHLAADGISARRGIMASHLQPAYAGHPGVRLPLPATERLTANTLVLPLYHELDEAGQDRVIDSIYRAAEGKEPCHM